MVKWAWLFFLKNFLQKYMNPMMNYIETILIETICEWNVYHNSLFESWSRIFIFEFQGKISSRHYPDGISSCPRTDPRWLFHAKFLIQMLPSLWRNPKLWEKLKFIADFIKWRLSWNVFLLFAGKSSSCPSPSRWCCHVRSKNRFYSETQQDRKSGRNLCLHSEIWLVRSIRWVQSALILSQLSIRYDIYYICKLLRKNWHYSANWKKKLQN